MFRITLIEVYEFFGFVDGNFCQCFEIVDHGNCTTTLIIVPLF